MTSKCYKTMTKITLHYIAFHCTLHLEIKWRSLMSLRAIELSAGNKCFTLSSRGKEIVERSVQVEQRGKKKGACKHAKSRVLISVATDIFASYQLSCAAEQKTKKKRNLVVSKVCQVLKPVC